ncbi:efflux RND transporter periplasmic adaptor subunit [Methylobacterium nodulans]|uniref:Efflux transporter, RND family, MFP subunit n=1 Tax=Methylobacterium nodulans (strain LMG 21967 / CNCM I-2342 / ORS 2060) TaxID=460265 RepID=B8II89_METNO|nr:efflux RND transporter periplasmic adaptor subunit [Methylobacterium nodulans]ACL57958.1 efflux transporter, RND family, MFP subunit [Methylobacterium nodulans ORS 2060]
MQIHRPTSRALPLVVPLWLTLAACQPLSRDSSSAASVPEVSTVAAAAATVPLTLDLPGRLAPTRVAEVRAQVSGIIQERMFEEGSLVRKGDVLFRIDPAVYKAEVDARAAALDRAEATRDQALRQSERAETLLERQATSSAQHDIAVAALRQAEADVASARAQLARARIELDYATVRAPIGGRIGRALATEGALVSQNDATRLAVIQQIDPIYADFMQSASDPSPLTERAAGKEATEVRLVDSDGTPYADTGQLLFTDASVDPGTGQVSLRATFPNPRAALLPGTYVRVRVAQGVKADATIVPAQAIQRSSAGEAQAFVVEEGNRVMLRPLNTGALTDAGWIVEEGLRPGEIVVVEGFQKIQPGVSVKPVPWKGSRTAETSARP